MARNHGPLTALSPIDLIVLGFFASVNIAMMPSAFSIRNRHFGLAAAFKIDIDFSAPVLHVNKSIGREAASSALKGPGDVGDGGAHGFTIDGAVNGSIPNQHLVADAVDAPGQNSIELNIKAFIPLDLGNVPVMNDNRGLEGVEFRHVGTVGIEQPNRILPFTHEQSVG